MSEMAPPVSTSAEWQALLDEKFPQGAIVSPVRSDGSLSAKGQYLCPVLVVMAMRGDWPLVVGISADGHDIQLYVASWQEIDRSGHFVARVKMAPVAGSPLGEYEINSWLTEVMVAAFDEVRDAQREWLMQVAESAEEETPLEVASDTEVPEDRAPSAEPTEDMALTLSHI